MQQNINLYSNAQIRQLEQIAINDYNISEKQLMERAGTAAFELLKNTWPTATSVTVFCGGGNNAGDGYVLAHLAQEAGMLVQCIHLVSIENLPSVANAFAQTCIQKNIVMAPWNEDIHIDGDVIVDAIFGTGLTREVTGDWFKAITAINQAKKPVLAIDVPSGLNSDNGSCHGISVKANKTITFIAEKLGLYTGQAADYCGEIICNRLNIPEEAFLSVKPFAEKIQYSLNHYLPRRSRCANKADFGHVVIIGGNYGMPGAVCMAARAALRIGAGRVSVATRPEHVSSIVAQQAEIMCHGVSAFQDIYSLVKRASVMVIGPGLGCDQWAQALFNETIKQSIPLIIDADGLNLLAKSTMRSQQWLLTPHPGEAARLLDCDTITIQKDRISAVKNIQSKYGGVCVLKGAGTLIASEETLDVCPIANPAMASAGMGDILSGVLSGLVAQGLSLLDAAKIGVDLHARAALRAASQGERGVLATDLLMHLQSLINE